MTKTIAIENFLKYEVFILVGFVMVVATLLKLFNVVYFSSDWFWFLAGMGFVVEGSIALAKQKKFDKKFKIIERPDSEKA
ncbi:MAG TPA: hypothetical protein VJH92_06225 [Candidatus Nanoarchaeia archaeon]|nr:hypothetical protein [Candidatus Nanoarchaeia archaeon]